MFFLSSRIAGALTLALLLVGGAAPLAANADGLSLAESERIAVERDAMLREMRDAIIRILDFMMNKEIAA